MSRRNTELLLLCLAAPFVVLLFAMVLVQQGTALSLESLTAPLGLFAAFVVAHIATRFLAKNADPAILPITFGLSGIGIAFVTRLAPDLAVSQIIWLFVGIACMVITLAVVRNIDRLSQYKYTFMVLGIILLLSPMIPGLGQGIERLAQLIAIARCVRERVEPGVHANLHVAEELVQKHAANGGKAEAHH